MKDMHSVTPRLFVIFATTCLALAQNGFQERPGEANRTQSDASTAVEPRVLTALKLMSDQLRAASSYSFTVHVMEEEPATNGQMLDFFKVIHVEVKRPDKLRLTQKSDGTETTIWYDGKNVTLMPASQQFYASLPAAPTLNGTLPVLRDHLEVNQFVRTFLSDDPYAEFTDGLSTGNEVGFVDVRDQKVLQIAFTEPDASWQLWLSGPKPMLPSRLAVIYKTAPDAPRAALEFSDWNLNAGIPDQTFVFTKPAGAKQVDFKNLEPRAPVQK